MTTEAPVVGQSEASLWCRPSTSNSRIDYSLNNPDTLTKYKVAAQISQKALETISGMDSSELGYHEAIR